MGTLIKARLWPGRCVNQSVGEDRQERRGLGTSCGQLTAHSAEPLRRAFEQTLKHAQDREELAADIDLSG